MKRGVPDTSTRLEIKRLIRVLENESEEVNYHYEAEKDQAVMALIHDIGEAAVEPLINALRKGDMLLQERVAKVLGSLTDARAVEPLVHVLTHDPDLNVQFAVINALGRIGDPRAVEPLIQVLRRRCGSSSFLAARALGRIRDPRAVEPLIQHLEPTETPCPGTIQALEAIGDARAIEPLVQVLKHSHPVYVMERLAATKALGAIGGASAVEPLIQVLKDAGPWAAEESVEVIRALETIGDTRAVEPLVQIVKDTDSTCVDELLAALKAVGDPNAIWYSQEIKSAIASVRHAAIGALGSIGDRAAVELLFQLLSDEAETVREAAMSALQRIEAKKC